MLRLPALLSAPALQFLGLKPPPAAIAHKGANAAGRGYTLMADRHSLLAMASSWTLSQKLSRRLAR